MTPGSNSANPRRKTVRGSPPLLPSLLMAPQGSETFRPDLLDCFVNVMLEEVVVEVEDLVPLYKREGRNLQN